MTHSGTAPRRPTRPGTPSSGPFSQVVAGDGFEPSKAEPTVLQPAPSARVTPPLTSTYVLRGGSSGCRRPLCVRAPWVRGAAQPTDGALSATDGRGGSGHADHPSGFRLRPGISGCLLMSPSASWLCSDSGWVSWVPSVSVMRLLGGVGLPVDDVRSAPQLSTGTPAASLPILCGPGLSQGSSA